MKAILITDEHIQVANANIQVYEQQKRAFNEMFQYMKDNNIKYIFSLGDFFDNRININIRIMNNILKDFFDVIKENNYHITMLVGNHNMFNSDSLEVNNLEFLERIYPNNVRVIKTQTEVQFNDKKLLFAPWLLPNEKITNSNIDLVLAHAEVNTFNVSKTFECNSKHALNPEDVKIPMLSGHFHSFQQKGNITYLGNSFIQDTWTSYGELKGFHVLNEDLSLTFIECINGAKHLKVYIDSEEKTIEISDGITTNKYDINTKLDLDELVNNKVKLIIDKDNAFNKKLIEKIKPLVLSFKVDILETEDNVELSEVKEYKEYNIGHSIGEMLDTTYQQSVFEDIMKKSLVDMKE